MYRLSEEAKEILERKAQALKISKSKVLEWMILEFSPSTGCERYEQFHRKHEAEDKYLKDHISRTFSGIRDAWRDGWKTGWLHFQIRKSTHPFKLEN